MSKLGKNFFQRSAIECVKDFLGKVLVRQMPEGRMAGIIYDVEAYPAFVDEVHHGQKKTARSEVMYGEGGYAYVYLIYGMWYQFSAVVNGKDIPDVVFIRAVLPIEGIELMQRNWDKPVAVEKLADSPGKLCKSFGITKAHYGADLTGDELWLEDRVIVIPKSEIQSVSRVGISDVHKGHDLNLRFWIKPSVYYTV